MPTLTPDSRQPLSGPLLTARQRGQAADAVPLASLLRQLHLRFQPLAGQLGVDFTLQLDTALAPLLLLDSAVLQHLLQQLLAHALHDHAAGKLMFKAQVWAQQHMRQILTLELTASRSEHDGAVPEICLSGPARARKPQQAPAGWLRCRQLARRLGAELKMEQGRQGMHACLQLSPAMPGMDEAHAPAALGRWPVLLLCADAAQGRPIMQLLQETGYPLEIVSTASAALQYWQQHTVALLLADSAARTDLPVLLDFIRSKEASQPWRGHTPLLAVRPDTAVNVLATDMVPDGWLNLPGDRAALHPWLPECASGGDTALPVLDRCVLFDLSQGDWALELPLLQGYLQDKHTDLQQLLQAWQQGDLPACVALAHRIKGASRTVGARRLAEAAASLEQAARAGLDDQLPAMLLTLEQALEDFAQHLQSVAGWPADKPGTGMA